MTTETITRDELPLLDEPLAVEFANSLYGMGPPCRWSSAEGLYHSLGFRDLGRLLEYVPVNSD